MRERAKQDLEGEARLGSRPLLPGPLCGVLLSSPPAPLLSFLPAPVCLLLRLYLQSRCSECKPGTFFTRCSPRVNRAVPGIRPLRAACVPLLCAGGDAHFTEPTGTEFSLQWMP